MQLIYLFLVYWNLVFTKGHSKESSLEEIEYTQAPTTDSTCVDTKKPLKMDEILAIRMAKEFKRLNWNDTHSYLFVLGVNDYYSHTFQENLSDLKQQGDVYKNVQKIILQATTLMEQIDFDSVFRSAIIEFVQRNENDEEKENDEENDNGERVKNVQITGENKEIENTAENDETEISLENDKTENNEKIETVEPCEKNDKTEDGEENVNNDSNEFVLDDENENDGDDEDDDETNLLPEDDMDTDTDFEKVFAKCKATFLENMREHLMQTAFNHLVRGIVSRIMYKKEIISLVEEEVGELMESISNGLDGSFYNEMRKNIVDIKQCITEEDLITLEKERSTGYKGFNFRKDGSKIISSRWLEADSADHCADECKDLHDDTDVESTED